MLQSELMNRIRNGGLGTVGTARLSQLMRACLASRSARFFMVDSTFYPTGPSGIKEPSAHARQRPREITHRLTEAPAGEQNRDEMQRTDELSEALPPLPGSLRDSQQHDGWQHGRQRGVEQPLRIGEQLATRDRIRTSPDVAFAQGGPSRRRSRCW